MAQQPTPVKSKKGDLGTRVLSALILGPLVLLIIFLGSPYSDVLFLVAGGLMAWEWARLCGGSQMDSRDWILVAAVLLGIAGAIYLDVTTGAAALALGAAVVAIVCRKVGAGGVFWRIIGIGYIGLACIAFYWMRLDPTQGRVLIFGLLGVVWATDTAAYFTGRAFGGPKLAPAISPNKTWSGLIGGMIAAAVFVVCLAVALGLTNYGILALLGAGLAVVAQLGDLFESHLKRRFGAKDSSNLIPGHGGILDRVDGLMSASLFAAVLFWIWGGPT